MIIYGTYSIKTTLDHGQFFCPVCNRREGYTLKSARPFGHIYFIPLFPVGSAVRYVECHGCRKQLQERVLLLPMPSVPTAPFPPFTPPADEEVPVVFPMAEAALPVEPVPQPAPPAPPYAFAHDPVPVAPPAAPVVSNPYGSAPVIPPRPLSKGPNYPLWIGVGLVAAAVLLVLGMLAMILMPGKTQTATFSRVGSAIAGAPATEKAPVREGPEGSPDRVPEPQLPVQPWVPAPEQRVLPKANPEPINPVTLAGPDASPDWIVVFRSHDPAIWDKDVSGGDQHFARPLAGVPADVHFLRVRRNSEYVIVDTTRDRLKKDSGDSRYGWYGVNEARWHAHHLGAYDRQMKYKERGEICIRQPSVFDWNNGWGFGHLGHNDSVQGYCWEGKAIPPTVLEIAVKPGSLTAAEEKKLLRNVIKTDPIRPAKLEGGGISKDWQVLFCSADPSIWDTEVKKDANHFAKPLSAVKDDIRFLRIRKNEDYAILPMTRDGLKKLTQKGGHGWEGTNHQDSGAYHLGIFAQKWPSQQRGGICVRCLPWYAGWGFGHIAWVPNEQGYCWEGRPIGPTVFEIAVKPGELTEAEEEKLVTRATKPKPIQPETLAGNDISKDWQVLFCSADPTIWDSEVKKDANHFARPLAAVTDEIQYLRLRKTGDYVIISMTRERLKKRSEEGRFGWEGTNFDNSGGRHLGIFGMHMRAKNRGDISISHFPCPQGWGFGHQHFVNQEQGYSWNAEVLPPMVFEIAVKKGDLTEAEAKKVLR